MKGAGTPGVGRLFVVVLANGNSSMMIRKRGSLINGREGEAIHF